MLGVETGSLTAKEILKKIFRAKSNEQILHKVSSGVKGTRVNSFTIGARLISYRAGEFLKTFWDDFQTLGAKDRGDVAHVIVPKLVQSAEFRSAKKGGRPKGTTRDTNWQITIAAALSILGCSEAGIVQFLYPGKYSDYSTVSWADYASAGREAVHEFLERHAMAINRQKAEMTEDLAVRTVRGSITEKSAQHILSLNR